MSDEIFEQIRREAAILIKPLSLKFAGQEPALAQVLVRYALMYLYTWTRTDCEKARDFFTEISNAELTFMVEWQREHPGWLPGHPIPKEKGGE